MMFCPQAHYMPPNKLETTEIKFIQDPLGSQTRSPSLTGKLQPSRTSFTEHLLKKEFKKTTRELLLDE